MRSVTGVKSLQKIGKHASSGLSVGWNIDEMSVLICCCKTNCFTLKQATNAGQQYHCVSSQRGNPCKQNMTSLVAVV